MILLGCQGRPLGCPEEDQMNWKLWSSHAIFRTGLTVLSSIRVTLWACSLVFFFGGLHKPQRSDLSRCVRRSNGVHESRGSQAYIFVNNVPPCCTRDDQQLWFILILASSVEFTLVECYGVVRGRPSVKMWLARNVTFFVTNMWRTSLWRFFVTDMWRASLWHFVWRTCDGCHVWRDRDGHVTDSCPVHYMSFRSGYDIPALSIQSAGHGVLGCWVALGFDSSVRRLVLFLSQGRFVSPERWRRVALLSPALQSEFSCRYHYFD